MNDKFITVSFAGKDVKLGLLTVFTNRLLTLDKPGFAEKIELYQDVLKKHDSIPRLYEMAEDALKPYEEFLE